MDAPSLSLNHSMSILNVVMVSYHCLPEVMAYGLNFVFLSCLPALPLSAELPKTLHHSVAPSSTALPLGNAAFLLLSESDRSQATWLFGELCSGVGEQISSKYSTTGKTG